MQSTDILQQNNNTSPSILRLMYLFNTSPSVLTSQLLFTLFSEVTLSRNVMLVLFWTATPSFLHTMYGAGAPFTGHHRLEVLFKNTYCVFGAWSNVGLTILDFKEKRNVIVRLLWCMHIKKYSNSDTIQCSGQSNIRILFVFLPFHCLRLSGCGLKDTVDLRVPTFYFVMF